MPKAAGKTPGELSGKNRIQQFRYGGSEVNVPGSSPKTSKRMANEALFLKPRNLVILKTAGQLSVEDITTMVLCKPKLLPLKSLTLEKLEKMQQAAQDTIRQQEMAEKERQITH
ncbi:BBSome-interacting protein 1 isoform X2 [Equus przewalskii]|uniref:BBSome-interacting protein 1 isoform X2 n=1 Tax=Equus przewalskii TaxID=9798 RepID=A0ABM4QHY5_EQUPR|nr:BBSome-interacting protein 1 isoform X2 [Equus caballus]XP_023495316.1 BBSome-interacting protein 1 isoform X2 [Equus caballus]XP_023495321.1 BBSome-interacting protein 1 isoform X2 [Equus caballus]XP_023495322.1 BBSome-interacting protein 1 isoform X2 [Equus caballus]